MSSLSTVKAPTLADAIPGGIVRNVALVAGGAGFVGLSAQLIIPLPFTPVPLTLQTFAVLLTVAALGKWRGLASMGLYLAAGVAGVPWFSEQNSGYLFPAFGYILGFLLAAILVGHLAERGADRHVLKTAGTMIVGNLAIYAVGVPWLMLVADVSLGKALVLGVLPFLIGDVIKIVAAAGLLPATWKLLSAKS